MADGTGISWTDATWNPVRGCSRVSAGCVNCYAERQAIRHAGAGGAYEGLARMVNGHPAWTGKITLVPELLEQPLKWRRARRVFVNSMSDLFHENVPFEFIDRVFAVMALSPQHTFQILTKRPERMQEYLANPARSMLVRNDMEQDDALWWRAHERWLQQPDAPWWPLPNVHLGVSVEDQATADERIPELLDTPTAVRFVSYEPALAAVTWWRVSRREGEPDEHGRVLGNHINPLTGEAWDDENGELPEARTNRIDWLIVGGESGPGARPCDVEWIRSAVRQCREAGVPVFVKQLGARCFMGQAQSYEGEVRDIHLATVDRKGADPAEWPEDLRVQEFPA